MNRIKRQLPLWRGAWRLAGGFCPKCYSSPPLESCSICEGSPDYSYRLSPWMRAEWMRRYERELSR